MIYRDLRRSAMERRSNPKLILDMETTFLFDPTGSILVFLCFLFSPLLFFIAQIDFGRAMPMPSADSNFGDHFQLSFSLNMGAELLLSFTSFLFAVLFDLAFYIAMIVFGEALLCLRPYLVMEFICEWSRHSPCDHNYGDTFANCVTITSGDTIPMKRMNEEHSDTLVVLEELYEAASVFAISDALILTIDRNIALVVRGFTVIASLALTIGISAFDINNIVELLCYIGLCQAPMLEISDYTSTCGSDCISSIWGDSMSRPSVIRPRGQSLARSFSALKTVGRFSGSGWRAGRVRGRHRD